MKTIAISRTLGEIKDQLEMLGYEVIFDDEIKHPVDIYIYLNDHSNPSLYSATQMLSSITSSDPLAAHQHGGTLLINGKDKTIEEIQYIIQNRVYSPIF